MWKNWAQAPSWGSLYIIKCPVKPVTGGLPLLCSDVVPLLPLLDDCRCDEGRVCPFTSLPLCHCFTPPPTHLFQLFPCFSVFSAGFPPLPPLWPFLTRAHYSLFSMSRDLWMPGVTSCASQTPNEQLSKLHQKSLVSEETSQNCGP